MFIVTLRKKELHLAVTTCWDCRVTKTGIATVEDGGLR